MPAATRKQLIADLEAARKSRVLCYVTGDRQNQQIQIGDDVLPILSEHLADIGNVPRLDLVIYSRGGHTLTGFALANALREFATSVGVLVPFRAQSCATLIALSANEIVMGPMAQLGPVDPTITTPHGPSIQAGNQMQFIPVSVEDVANFLELARKDVGLEDDEHLAGVLKHLCDRVSPLALGAVYRAREQIGMLGSKLLALHMKNKDKREKIMRTLTRELLSHDYVINRREAKTIGLPVVDAPKDVATLIWALYSDFASELQLGTPWKAAAALAATGQPEATVPVPRGVLESANIKHVFETNYRLRQVQNPGAAPGVMATSQETMDESWRKV